MDPASGFQLITMASTRAQSSLQRQCENSFNVPCRLLSRIVKRERYQTMGKFCSSTTVTGWYRAFRPDWSHYECTIVFQKSCSEKRKETHVMERLYWEVTMKYFSLLSETNDEDFMEKIVKTLCGLDSLPWAEVSCDSSANTRTSPYSVSQTARLPNNLQVVSS